jgi:hypothetical protein
MNRQPVLNQAMHLMDHTESVMNQACGVAQACYEDQGLSRHARQVPLSAKAMAVTASPARKLKVDMSNERPTRTVASNNEAGTAVVWAFGLSMAFVLGGLGFCILAPRPSSQTISASASVPYHNEVVNLRYMAENLTTADVATLAKGVQPDDVSSDEKHGMTPKDYADIQKLGPLAVIDREDRPELHWSEVSGDVCHALVKNIYASPSSSNVEVTVNGQSVGVSCAKDANAIVLAPRL